MKRASTWLVLALGLALVMGCSASSSETGSARFAVAVPQALTSEVSRVSVTSSGPDIPPVTVDLVLTEGVWGGTIGNLLAGPDRSFLAQAFDASGTLLFEGSATGVTISTNQTTLVAITLQQVNPPPPFDNEAPLIDWLVASSTSVSMGDLIRLDASAHDPDSSDTLSYAWSATAGSISSPSTLSTYWVAPSSTGIQTLTFTVTDSRGLSSSIVLAINVTHSGAEGDAQLSISFNSSPRVATLSATPTQLVVGQPTSVSVCASDPDGDNLSYSWSSSCAGSWVNASSSSAQFTPSLLPSGACNNCRLTVSVSDGRGGLTTGTVALCVRGTPPVNHVPPVIVRSYRSSDTATAGQVLTFEVVANDPEGSALSFAWTANIGSLGIPDTDDSRSRVTWTAPSCVRASAPPVITATVTNANHLTAVHRFTLSAGPACSSSGTWSPTSPMLELRYGYYSVTGLPDGRVLIAGGNSTDGEPLAAAELYDPSSDTWQATGSMTEPRREHQATLLPDGKVLISGGSNSSGPITTQELYDPAKGTWSTASALPEPLGGLLLLPNGKVVGFGSSATWFYDPASDTWSAAANPPLRPLGSGTLLADGRILFASWTGSMLYDPASDTWSATASPSKPLGGSVTLLANEKVLIAGGYDALDDFTTSRAELYDPDSGTWSPTGSMGEARVLKSATLLLDGKVLVAGGWNGLYILDTAELYDPATGTWTPTGSMTLPRAQHTATRLLDGRVLVLGPYASTGEVYTP